MTYTVLDWLDRSVQKYPDRLAIMDEKECLTYKEYYEKALGIAESICMKKNTGGG